MKVNGEYSFPARKELDMRLPNWVLGFFCFTALCFVASVVCALLPQCQPELRIFLPILGTIIFVAGFAVFLGWKNWGLVMLTEDILLYRTFWGNVYRLRASEIQGVYTSMDSVQVVFPQRKVHVEKIAVLSLRFRALLLEKGAWRSSGGGSPLR